MLNPIEASNGSEELARALAEALKDHPHAEVRVNPTVQAPIPPRIADNLLELLRRVQVTGMEAVGWAEAYHYVQQFATPQPGIPFTGLPSSPQ